VIDDSRDQDKKINNIFFPFVIIISPKAS